MSALRRGRAVGALLLLTVAAAACTPGPARPVIGLAGVADDSVAGLLRDVLRRQAAGAVPGPAIGLAVRRPVAGPPDIETEIRMARDLAAEASIVAVVGHAGRRASLASAAVYNARHVPQLVPGGASRLIAHAGAWTFPLAPSDSVEGRALVEFAAGRLQARRLAIAYENDEYGRGVRSGARAAAARRRLDLLDELPFDAGSDLGLLAQAMLARGLPDVVLLAASPRQLRRAVDAIAAVNPTPRFVAAVGGATHAALGVDSLARPTPELFVAAPWLPDPGDPAQEAFVREFALRAGRPPEARDAFVHDAVQLLATAVTTVGPDRVRLRDYLGSLGRSRPAFAGLTGPVAFGDAARPALVVCRVERDRLVPVWRPEADEAG